MTLQLDEHGLPAETTKTRKGMFSIKMTDDDWAALELLTDTFSTMRGRKIALSEAMRAALHQTAKKYQTETQTPPPRPPAKKTATAPACHVCEEMPDGKEYRCTECNRELAGCTLADGAAVEGAVVLIDPIKAKQPAAKKGKKSPNS